MHIILQEENLKNQLYHFCSCRELIDAKIVTFTIDLRY